MFANRNEFKKLAAVLLNGQRVLALYPAGHPQIKEALDECYLRLRELLQRERQLPIVLAGDEFVVGDLQVPVVGEALEELAESLRKASVEKLIFLVGIREWEIQSFLRVLNLEAPEIEEKGGIEAILKSEEVQNVVAGPLSIEPSEEPTPDLLVRAWEAYAAGLKVVRKLRHAYRNTGRIEHLDEAKEFINDLVEVGLQQTRPLLALQALKVHDEYSFTHSINVATLSLAIARGLNFSKYNLREIMLAALLHDVGKERVAKEVLRKPGKLDDIEWKEMSRHSLEGAKMLATTQGVGDLAPIVAYEHHLAQDRSRPDAAKWNPHLVSELVTIADVYDALRSTRPYRGEIPPDKAMEIMQQEAPTKFNPDLFEGFEKLVGYYPPGTCVRLQSGDVGIVYQTNPDEPRKPHVLLVRHEDDSRYEPPQRLNLGESDGQGHVAEVLDAEAVEVDPFDYL